MVSQSMYVCLSGPGAGPGGFNQSMQPPGGAAPPSHHPAKGLAQAQANNSNNKTGTYNGTPMSLHGSKLPEDLQQLMDDWAQEFLIVTQMPRSNSLSVSGQQLQNEVGSQAHKQLLSI